MYSLKNSAITLMLIGIMLTPFTYAHGATVTTNATSTAVLTQIQSLLAQILQLQKQLDVLKQELFTTIASDIREGMMREDIRTIQQLLATDPSIYPEGKITGYFGALTTNAIKRFQERHGLAVNGLVDDETRALLELYLHEGFGQNIPPGLLTAPGIVKKVETRYLEGCDTMGGSLGPLCKELKNRYGTTTPSTPFEYLHLKVTVTPATTTTATTTIVKFTHNDVNYTLAVSSTSLNDVLAAVANKLGVSVSALDARFVSQITDRLDQALK